MKTKRFFLLLAFVSLCVFAKGQNNTINGREYVDLGLPSGLKWAACNVGANSPEEYGDYYAWGEVSIKEEYTIQNSTCSGKKMDCITANPDYDVARNKWGATWRLPTKDELEELEKNCSWEWTNINRVNGYKVTSGKNGNSIFLPAAGFQSSSSNKYQGTFAYYWSSTPEINNDYRAWLITLSRGTHRIDRLNRKEGYSVRPVSE